IPQPTSVDFHFRSGLYRLIKQRVFSRALPLNGYHYPDLLSRYENCSHKNYVMFFTTFLVAFLSSFTY
ncbi:MAG: hypothetical protein KME30_33050, partial [Iphinoe sp. HA4291-MV1]|nr:hypothetical protein [Iphinoe sp. HA4291-MV1]